MYNNYIQLNLINEFFSGYDATAEQKCSKERGLGTVTDQSIGAKREEQTILSDNLSSRQLIMGTKKLSSDQNRSPANYSLHIGLTK